MTALKPIFLVLALALAQVSYGQGILLNAGDTWSYSFKTLNYLSSLSTELGPITTGGDLFFSSFATGQVRLQIDLFESADWDGLFLSAQTGNPAVGPSLAGTNTTGLLLNPGVWQDLDGSVRFTVLAGSISIENVVITAYHYIPDSPAQVDTFQRTVTLIPEPTPRALACAIAILFCFRRRTPLRVLSACP